jgi:hypothetical protein
MVPISVDPDLARGIDPLVPNLQHLERNGFLPVPTARLRSPLADNINTLYSPFLYTAYVT